MMRLGSNYMWVSYRAVECVAISTYVVFPLLWIDWLWHWRSCL